MEMINCIQQLPGAVALLNENLKIIAASTKWNDRYANSDNCEGKLITNLVPEISANQISLVKTCLQNEKAVFFQIKRLGKLAKKWSVKTWKVNGKHIKGVIVESTNGSVLEEKFTIHFKREFLLESVLDNINTGIISCDRNEQLTLFNKASQSMHGLSDRKMDSEELATYYSLYDKDGVTLLKTEEIPLLNMLRDGVIKKKEMVIKSVDGKSVIVTVIGSRLYDQNGDIDGAVVAMHDVTERREAQKELKISEQTFRKNFEASAIGMAITGLEGECLKANNRLCEIMGYSHEEIIQLKFQEITHPDDLEKDIKLFRELIEGDREYYQIEKRAIHKTGKIIFLNIAVSIVRDNVSNPLYFISQISDVTAQKNNEEKISSILAITEDQNQRLKNFAHIVSHNLRSHSGNIEMLLDLFIEDNPVQEENELIKMLVKASNRLKETISHLNEVSLSNKSITKHITCLNLKQAVENTLDSINAIIQKHGVKIIIDIPSHYEVMCLPAYIESIILNFATNAIKFRSDKRHPFLKFHAEKKNEYIDLIIEDNGIGINLNNNSDKLFGMYKTFHKDKSSNGIGLFITRNQIEAVGGKVNVESKVGKGTRFIISFKYEKN